MLLMRLSMDHMLSNLYLGLPLLQALLLPLEKPGPGGEGQGAFVEQKLSGVNVLSKVY